MKNIQMSQFGYLLKSKSHFEYGLKEDPDPITTYAVKNENVQEEKTNKSCKKTWHFVPESRNFVSKMLNKLLFLSPPIGLALIFHMLISISVVIECRRSIYF